MNKYVRGGVVKQRHRLADTEAAGADESEGPEAAGVGDTDGTDGTEDTDGTKDTGGTEVSDAETLDLPAAEAPGNSPAPGDMEPEALCPISRHKNRAYND
eukprot:COSAG02_NODE_2338_length_9108_cov_17.856699_6_plen_100_part_00